jgi:hypothetical protein
MLWTRVPRGVERWCREGELNPQGTKYRRILSLDHSVSNSQKPLYFHIVTLISPCGAEQFCVVPNGPNRQSLGRGALVVISATARKE